MNTGLIYGFGIAGIVCHVLLIVFALVFLSRDIEFNVSPRPFRYYGYRTRLSTFSPTTWSWCNKTLVKTLLISCLESLPIHLMVYVLAVMNDRSYVLPITTMLVPSVVTLVGCLTVEIVGRKKFWRELCGI